MKILAILPNKRHDTITNLIMDGLDHTPDIEVICIDYSNNTIPENIVAVSHDVDYIFVFWCKRQYTYKPKCFTLSLLDKIGHPEKVVYIDGSEYNSTGHPIPNQAEMSKFDSSLCRSEPWIDEEMYKRCTWYFKRETYVEDLERKKISPLLVGAVSSYFGNTPINNNKKHDIFCSFGHTITGLRKEAQDICIKLKQEGYDAVIGNRFPYRQYINYIIDSYIGVSAWGAGNSCRRMWEIMSNKTCCFVQKKEIIFPNIFEDGVSYVEYSTPEEFEEKIRYYLNNKDKCIEIGINGYNHVKKYHTGIRRVEYIRNILSGSNWKNSL